MALVASLLFMVHPINTEAVNFISARNTILSSLFALLSFHVYIKHQRSQSVRHLYLSAALFLLGLLCKETAAMLLVVLALYEPVAWSRCERPLALTARLWPFALSMAIYIALRAIALSGTSGLDLELANLASRLFLNVTIVPKYLGLVLLPVGLSITRVPPDGGYPISIWTFASWIAIAGSIFVLWRTKSPPTRLGLLWFAVNYIPISNLVPTPSLPMAERSLYLPAIGIWWIVADQLSWVYDRSQAKRSIQVATAAALVTLACLSVTRNLDWRSSVSLFEREVKTNPSLADNHYNLCASYFESGDLPRAEAACVHADQLGPGNADVLTQLGNLQQAQSRHARALDYYQRAVEASPSHVKARYNLARLLENLGRPGVAFHHYLALQHSLPGDHYLQADVRSRLRNIAASLRAVP
jgi:tetratricopeptide (TPR) repeat protein